MATIVLSRFQADPLLRARDAGAAEATTSLDLGRSPTTVSLTRQGVDLGERRTLAWAILEEIAESENGCFVVTDGAIRKIQAFSEEFNRAYSLWATSGAPTVLISGFLMHRVKGTTPDRDTAAKIAAVRPIAGTVLDTATGLGYTAIDAARHGAEEVVTIELDPVMQEVARDNPWSDELFSNGRIRRLYGDAFDVIQELPDQWFARIVHDPPAFSLAGHLYSGEFYEQLRRVLKRPGRLFHYIGDLESRSGRRVAQGAIQRLRAAGFSRVTPRPEAFGLVASL